jgi:hypothetical protein
MRDRGYFDCAVVMRFVFDGPLGVPVFPVVGWGEGRCPDGFVWLFPELHAAARPTRPTSRSASVRLTPRSSPTARAKNRGQTPVEAKPHVRVALWIDRDEVVTPARMVEPKPGSDPYKSRLDVAAVDSRLGCAM